jgi:hypothetical protein
MAAHRPSVWPSAGLGRRATRPGAADSSGRAARRRELGLESERSDDPPASARIVLNHGKLALPALGAERDNWLGGRRVPTRAHASGRLCLGAACVTHKERRSDRWLLSLRQPSQTRKFAHTLSSRLARPSRWKLKNARPHHCAITRPSDNNRRRRIGSSRSSCRRESQFADGVDQASELAGRPAFAAVS